MIRLLAFAFVILAASGAQAQPTACPQFFPGGQPPELVNPKLAQRTTLLCNDAYAVLASGVTHGPIWSAERLTAASVVAARRLFRQGTFHADDRLAEADRAELRDYSRSGYDRGHQVPSGDAPTARAQGQTFSLANMAPQTPELNRGVWERIESAVRRLATRRGELYVVTGPAFQGQTIRSIGPDTVLVPSSTWKAIFDPAMDGAGAYLCSNTAAPQCDLLSVAAFIGITGVDPFPAVSESVKHVAMRLPRPQPSPYARRHDQRLGHSRPGPREQQEPK